MAGIIKATDRNRGIQTVAFSFEDITAKAEAYLAGVRAEAAKILAQAHQEAAAIRKRAEAEGHRAGQAAVEQMVRDQVARQMTTALPALRQAVDEIRHARHAWLTHWQKSAVQVATAIARRILRRELAHQPQLALELVREALELAAGNPRLRIRLNPADHAALASQVQRMVEQLAPLGTAEIVADPQIDPGGCRLETQFGVIDQQIETQLARIAEELT